MKRATDIRKYYNDAQDRQRATIIEPTKEAAESYGLNYGSQLLEVTEKQIRALLNGKAWAFVINGAEYSQFIVLKKKRGSGETGRRNLK